MAHTLTPRYATLDATQLASLRIALAAHNVRYADHGLQADGTLEVRGVHPDDEHTAALVILEKAWVGHIAWATVNGERCATVVGHDLPRRTY